MDKALAICWIVDWKGQEQASDTAPVASNRYRVLMPAQALRALGCQVEIVTLQSLRDTPRQSWAGVDVVVVGKLHTLDMPLYARESALLLGCCTAARAQGARIVCDIIDNHFHRPTIGDHWKNLVSTADVCVVGSPAMAQVVNGHGPRQMVVVGDPLASPRGKPRVYADRAGAVSRFLGTEPLKLVWYGSPTNLPALVPWIKWFADVWDRPPLHLRVVTQLDAENSSMLREVGALRPKRCRVEPVEWSEAAQWHAVDEADIVLIPADITGGAHAVKTANRLTDALHAGRYVIASPLSSYKPYERFADLGNNPVSALHAYLRDPDDARERIAQGQAAVQTAASPAAIGTQWLAAFHQASTSQQTVAAAPELTQPSTSRPDAEPIRLNLGCGDKILADYVNVDIAPSRGGKRPDVIADLRDLAIFEDAYADEVMAIHVIEHFWRWEVEAVLAEWIRVLKPGGLLVLECPNLLAACEALLRDPQTAAGPGREGQATMWVFYGDPAWKDPLMNHRWGYTPDSLCSLLRTAGLLDVHQEPAQFKLREPRDMRIVGRKPLA